MHALVWVDEWQFACCGEPFSVYSRLWWNLIEPDVEWLSTFLGPDEASRVTYAEDHHGPDGIYNNVFVRGIRAVHCGYVFVPGHPPRTQAVEGTTQFRGVDRVDRVEWSDEPEIDGVDLDGYLVDIEL